jgi:hypothetical protein
MPKGRPNAKHIRFTEEENALDYLERAYEALQRLRRQPQQWKWVIIGIHGALYGLAICVLKGTNWENVTRGPKQKLIAFDEALDRCQRLESMGFYAQSKPLQATTEQKDSIRFLKARRNQIEHYVPKRWLIEAHELTVTTIDALDVIRFLALESGNVRLKLSQRQRVQACTAKGKYLLKESQLYKDYLAAKKRLERSERKSS